MTHPFRKLASHSYLPDVEGDLYVAYIGPVGRLAMHFCGETQVEAEIKAEAFRLNALEEHEDALIRRKEAATKRKEKE